MKLIIDTKEGKLVQENEGHQRILDLLYGRSRIDF
jgi:hypothetical protein